MEAQKMVSLNKRVLEGLPLTEGTGTMAVSMVNRPLVYMMYSFVLCCSSADAVFVALAGGAFIS